MEGLRSSRPFPRPTCLRGRCSMCPSAVAVERGRQHRQAAPAARVRVTPGQGPPPQRGAGRTVVPRKVTTPAAVEAVAARCASRQPRRPTVREGRSLVWPAAVEARPVPCRLERRHPRWQVPREVRVPRPGRATAAREVPRGAPARAGRERARAAAVGRAVRPARAAPEWTTAPLAPAVPAARQQHPDRGPVASAMPPVVVAEVGTSGAVAGRQGRQTAVATDPCRVLEVARRPPSGTAPSGAPRQRPFRTSPRRGPIAGR